jgi:Tol biopolymer transport system component
VVIAALTAALVYALLSGRSAPDETVSLTSHPLTSEAGVEYAGSWSPDGSFFAYSHCANGPLDIFIRSTTGGEPVRLVESPADDNMPAWSPDNRWIAFVSGRGGVTGIYIVPPLGGTEQLLVETGLEPLGDEASAALGSCPWSPDGERLVFSRKGDGRIAVWIFDLTTGAERQLTHPDAGSSDGAAVWSYDGASAAFMRRSSDGYSVWVVPAAGGEPRRIAAEDVGETGIGWSPDGEHLVYGTQLEGGARNLWSVNISSGARRQLTFGTLDIGSVAVGRDGRILYSDFSHQTDLYLQSLDGGEPRRLTFHTRSNFGARISPEGERVAYHSDRTGNDEIWMLDLATGKDRQLTDHEAGDFEPDWSPDGRRLAFASDRTGSSRIWLVEAAGGAARPLSDRDGAWLPRWSPDGATIGYLASSEEGTALWLAPVGGGAARKLLEGVSDFCWYRDARRVIYTPYDMATEIRVIDLETGRDELLFDGPHLEVAVDPNGRALTYCAAVSHFNMNLQVLWLEEDADGLPRATGPPEALTAGEGLWHVHNGGWAPDGRSVVYTRDTDTGNVHVLEGAF